MNILAAFGALAVVTPAPAANGYVANATVNSLYINEQLGSRAWIQVSGAENVNPSCSRNILQFVLDLTHPNANHRLAALLTARTTQMPLGMLVGNSACDMVGDTEPLIVVLF